MQQTRTRAPTRRKTSTAIRGSKRQPPFDTGAEHVKPDEQAAIASINEVMQGIRETTWHDYGHSVRSVHAKSHGLLEGELRVLDNLPATLAQGLFAQPAAYPVVLRISTNPGDILDDTVSSPRGLAIKVIGVPGERLPGSENDATQDFVMVNAPAFAAPDAQGFVGSLKLLAATTDTGQAWKKGLSALLRAITGALPADAAAAGKLKALGGHPLTHPLGETFYSTTPFRYGNGIAKFSVVPVSPELVALKDAPVDLSGKPNGLRSAVIEFFRANAAKWELRVQLRTNPETMPVEDAAVAWPESESPYVAVAEITVGQQPAWSEERALQVDDALSFSPWHGILAHQPLGSVNRARQTAYSQSAGFRASHNRCPIHEPSAKPDLSQQPASEFGTSTGREGRRPNTPDARPGSLGQPLNATARKLVSGSLGGLAAGVLLSAFFLGLESASGEPSDLIKLKRRTVRRAGWRDKRDRAWADAGEQAFAHGGHLALSVVAGAAYGMAKPDTMPPLAAGTLFGAGFYALAYGAAGPGLGVTPKLTRDTPASIVQHGLFHILFGVVTALVTEEAARRL